MAAQMKTNLELVEINAIERRILSASTSKGSPNHPHVGELRAVWALAQAGREVERIAPRD